jgi:hypothetical protein
MEAAEALFTRRRVKLAKAKRSGSGKTRGARGRSLNHLHALLQRAAKKEASLARFRDPARAKAKDEPKRPPDPPNSKPKPT